MCDFGTKFKIPVFHSKERKRKMNIKKHLTAIAAVLSVSLTAAAFGFTLADNYSGSDPLISKSYLDNVFLGQVTSYVDEKIAQVPAAQSNYEVITLQNGQTLCATGSLEFILRPGATATVVSPIPENGIAELSSSTELYHGMSVPINAYCLVPRGDGRGILCTSETAYVMVRGAYEIR